MAYSSIFWVQAYHGTGIKYMMHVYHIVLELWQACYTCMRDVHCPRRQGRQGRQGELQREKSWFNLTVRKNKFNYWPVLAKQTMPSFGWITYYSAWYIHLLVITVFLGIVKWILRVNTCLLLAWIPLHKGPLVPRLLTQHTNMMLISKFPLSKQV